MFLAELSAAAEAREPMRPSPPGRQVGRYPIEAPGGVAARCTAVQVLLAELAARGLRPTEAPEVHLTSADRPAAAHALQ